MHKGCEVGGGRGGTRKVAGTRKAATKAKAKGKAKAATPEVGPSRPAKRARVYELEPPTDLESDELAAAVLAAGKEIIGIGEGMKRFGEAIRRMGEALNKHDL